MESTDVCEVFSQDCTYTSLSSMPLGDLFPADSLCSTTTHTNDYTADSPYSDISSSDISSGRDMHPYQYHLALTPDQNRADQSWSASSPEVEIEVEPQTPRFELPVPEMTSFCASVENDDPAAGSSTMDRQLLAGPTAGPSELEHSAASTQGGQLLDTATTPQLLARDRSFYECLHLENPAAVTHHYVFLMTKFNNSGNTYSFFCDYVDPDSETPYKDIAQTKKEKKNGKPKRPMNAFMVFAQEERRKLTAFTSNKNAVISKHLGMVWKLLPESVKKFFMNRADLLKKLHQKEYPDYRYQPQKKGAAAGKSVKAPGSSKPRSRPRPRKKPYMDNPPLTPLASSPEHPLLEEDGVEPSTQHRLTPHPFMVQMPPSPALSTSPLTIRTAPSPSPHMQPSTSPFPSPYIYPPTSPFPHIYPPTSPFPSPPINPSTSPFPSPLIQPSTSTSTGHVAPSKVNSPSTSPLTVQPLLIAPSTLTPPQEKVGSSESLYWTAPPKGLYWTAPPAPPGLARFLSNIPPSSLHAPLQTSLNDTPIPPAVGKRPEESQTQSGPVDLPSTWKGMQVEETLGDSGKLLYGKDIHAALDNDSCDWDLHTIRQLSCFSSSCSN